MELNSCYYYASFSVIKRLRQKTAGSKNEELMNQIVIRFAGLIASARSQGVENLEFFDVDLNQLNDPDVYHDVATAMYLAGSIATLAQNDSSRFKIMLAKRNLFVRLSAAFFRFRAAYLMD